MTRNPRLALLPWLACSIAAALSSPVAADGPARKPNILILLADDQRADAVGTLGSRDLIRTPNITRLTIHGTALDAYCMGSLQGAVCVPSRAMLLTGRTLFHVKDDLAGQATWPEAFAKAGYSTFLTGKWHNGAASALRVFDRGRTVFLGGMGDPYRLPIRDITAEHKFTDSRPSGEHSVKAFADAASDFLRGQDGGRPFLCYVAFNLPHDPRVAPRAYHERYDANPPPLPANFLPVHPFDNGALVIRDEELAPWPRTPEVVRKHLGDYYAAVEYLDAQVGRILEALKASGQYDNTLIVYASDHGLAIGSHGLFGKQNLYEHSMRAPLIFAGPGVKHCLTSAKCYLLDVFPTLGELAGIPAPEGSEGRSLAPLLRGEPSGGRDVIFTAYGNSQRAINDYHWKMIVYPQINKLQLFDLRSDPLETRDLSADPGHSGEVTRLAALLADQQRRYGDTQPLTVPNPKPQAFEFPKAGTPGR
jgi:arylsulfatase A-like enzyme